MTRAGGLAGKSSAGEVSVTEPGALMAARAREPRRVVIPAVGRAPAAGGALAWSCIDGGGVERAPSCVGSGIGRFDAVGLVGDSVATGPVATDPVATGGVVVATGGVVVATGGVVVAPGVAGGVVAGVVRAGGVVGGGGGVAPDDAGGGVAADPSAAGDGVPRRAEVGSGALAVVGVLCAGEDPALARAGAGAGFLVPGALALGAGAATGGSGATRMDARMGVAGEG